jgi:hypothetical protein
MGIQHERGCPTGSRNLGWRSGETVNCFFERCALPVRLRRELAIAVVLVIVIVVLVIFMIIHFTREEALKHGQPNPSSTIRHGSGKVRQMDDACIVKTQAGIRGFKPGGRW